MALNPTVAIQRWERKLRQSSRPFHRCFCCYYNFYGRVLFFSAVLAIQISIMYVATNIHSDDQRHHNQQSLHLFSPMTNLQPPTYKTGTSQQWTSALLENADAESSSAHGNVHNFSLPFQDGDIGEAVETGEINFSGETGGDESNNPSDTSPSPYSPPPPLLLLGIMSTSNSNTAKVYRNKHRKLFALWNDSRLCSFGDYVSMEEERRSASVPSNKNNINGRYGSSDNNDNHCQIVYTFVLGAHHQDSIQPESSNKPPTMHLGKYFRLSNQRGPGPNASTGTTSNSDPHNSVVTPIALQYIPNNSSKGRNKSEKGDNLYLSTGGADANATILPRFKDVQRFPNQFTLLNIQENMNQGKTPTFFAWAVSQAKKYNIPLIAKCDSDSMFRWNPLLQFLQQELVPILVPPVSTAQMEYNEESNMDLSLFGENDRSINDNDNDNEKPFSSRSQRTQQQEDPNHIILGALRHKAFWAHRNVQRQNPNDIDRKRLEEGDDGYDFWQEEYYSGLQLYLAGQLYMISTATAEEMVQEAARLLTLSIRQTLQDDWHQSSDSESTAYHDANDNTNRLLYQVTSQFFHHHQPLSAEADDSSDLSHIPNDNFYYYLEGHEDHDAVALLEYGHHASGKNYYNRQSDSNINRNEHKENKPSVPIRWIILPKQNRFWEHPVKGDYWWKRIYNREIQKYNGTTTKAKDGSQSPPMRRVKLSSVRRRTAPPKGSSSNAGSGAQANNGKYTLPASASAPTIWIILGASDPQQREEYRRRHNLQREQQFTPDNEMNDGEPTIICSLMDYLESINATSAWEVAAKGNSAASHHQTDALSSYSSCRVYYVFVVGRHARGNESNGIAFPTENVHNIKDLEKTLHTKKQGSTASRSDFKESDMLRLSIRDNIHQGMGQTVLYYIQQRVPNYSQDFSMVLFSQISVTVDVSRYLYYHEQQLLGRRLDFSTNNDNRKRSGGGSSINSINRPKVLMGQLRDKYQAPMMEFPFRNESYWYKEHENIHLYMASECLAVSTSLIDGIVQQAQTQASLRSSPSQSFAPPPPKVTSAITAADLANKRWLSLTHLGHDLTTLAYLIPKAVLHWIPITKSLQFWESQ